MMRGRLQPKQQTPALLMIITRSREDKEEYMMYKSKQPAHTRDGM